MPTAQMRLLSRRCHRVGPSYLYPAVTATPGVVNSDVTQANINDTICKSGWTATIPPPASYTTTLKTQQLGTSKFTDKTPSHYEDHFIALELGGHPHDPKNLWPEMWGTPATPLTSKGRSPRHTGLICVDLTFSKSAPLRSSRKYRHRA